MLQGLVHMGKGLLTLNPYHSDHTLLNGEALGLTWGCRRNEVAMPTRGLGVYDLRCHQGRCLYS